MDSIEKYLELSRTCTELFAQSEELPLVLDPKELYAFAQKSGRRIGIVYESHYHLMVVDVMRAKNGSLFAYERLMNRVTSCSQGISVRFPKRFWRRRNFCKGECGKRIMGRTWCASRKMEKFRKNCAGQWCNEFKGRCISGRVE